MDLSSRETGRTVLPDAVFPAAVLPGAEEIELPGATDHAAGVLLLHGFTGSPSSLRPLAAALHEAGFAVRAPLLPGHGTRWEDLAASTFDEWFAAAEAELAEMVGARGRPAVVVGHSNGGALSLLLAARHPSDVAGLVLINPAIALSDSRLKALPVLRRLRSSVAGIGGDVAKPGVAVTAYDRTPLAALASMVAGWRTVRAELPAVRCPLLLLRSRVDHVVDPSGARILLARISSADREVHVLERSFHEAPVDHDGPQVAEWTASFVRRVQQGLPARASGN